MPEKKVIPSKPPVAEGNQNLEPPIGSVDNCWRLELEAAKKEIERLKAELTGEKKKKEQEIDEIELTHVFRQALDLFEITDDFQQALDLMENSRDCLFITGKAGTGKSTLLTHFQKNTKKKLVVLAPTGLAAIKVRGQTIHSFFNFPLGPLAKRNIQRNPTIRDILKRADVLIIDEVSMVRADIMDGIDLSLRLNLENDQPFGGLRMVFFGDLYQLPPVVANGIDGRIISIGPAPAKVVERPGDNPGDRYILDKFGGRFFFNAKVFTSVDLKILELKKIFRQQDEHFINFLNLVRENKLTSEDLAELNTRLRLNYLNQVESKSLILCPTNRKAAALNRKKLSRLKSKTYVYIAEVEGRFNMKDCPADGELVLKVGAQIMMLRNDPGKRWVNGTIGTIHALKVGGIEVDLDGTIYEVGKEIWEAYQYVYDKTRGDIKANRVGLCRQYPLKLAWAVTIHKSQGQTLARVVIDFGGGGAFEHGQTYVALSRCSSFEGLSLAPGSAIRPRDIILNPEVIKFINKYQEKSGIIEEELERPE